MRISCEYRSIAAGQFVSRNHGEGMSPCRAVGDQCAAIGRTDNGEGCRCRHGRSPWRSRKCEPGANATRYDAAIPASHGASARAAICADEQIGAPAQATIRRRGSSARTMKPSFSAAADETDTAVSARPMSDQERRSAAARMPIAPASLAASAKRSSVVASAWPKASPTPHASDPSRSRCDADWVAATAAAAGAAFVSAIKRDQHSEGRAKRRRAFGRQNVARPRRAAASRDDFEQPHGGIDAVAGATRRVALRSRRHRRR